jgi:hypothetical protein
MGLLDELGQLLQQVNSAGALALLMSKLSASRR